ncbi:MAG: hypothetical protein JWM62_1685 [Frankiales bacterium]|nr:hypothetical protein [Frankiales bacterium]
MRDLHPWALRVLVAAGLEPDDLHRAINRGSLHRCWSSDFVPHVLRWDLREVFRQWWTASRSAVDEPAAAVPAQRAPAVLSAHG